MPLEISYHGERPVGERGAKVDALGRDRADAIILANGDTTGPLAAGFYEILATAACRVRVGGAGLADASGGRQWPAGKDAVRWVEQNGVIAVDAL